MGLFHFNEDRKHYCGTYKGFKVWQYGCMIGSNWYGDFYITIPKGKSKREMKVKESVCKSLDALKAYVDNHFNEIKIKAEN